MSRKNREKKQNRGPHLRCIAGGHINRVFDLRDRNTLNRAGPPLPHYAPREIRRLAICLKGLCRIPDGSHLILLLGNGFERDNLEAIETWVTEQLPLVDESTPKTKLEHLSQRLVKHLQIAISDLGSL